ncbi:MAG: hypothetical protein A2096_14780 [Spirochaetes bacterium GWF1_41_5]|nr:MAG: hypothetical protein A2096_14780 [Spirochaetes bacterium GWF1_41_5]
MTFALFFGNRGFFPENLIAGARQELSSAITALGYDYITCGKELTRYGAVETPQEGEKYARFLEEHKNKYDGVILCLPNFGDETGATAALKKCGVPVLIMAYPDELSKMNFTSRRDAFCGKLSVMDVFYQYGIKYTAWQPHVLTPSDTEFSRQMRQFAAVCRIVNNMHEFTIGAVGARTTAFKTVRFDELAMQKKGITVEALDLSDVFQRVRSISENSKKFIDRKNELSAYSDFSRVPEKAFSNLVKVSLVLDAIISEYKMDALALRCWMEMEKELGIAPCVLLGELNSRLFPAACELDVGNALAMTALRLASEKPAACLDWNNNYGSEPDKCILFHCGPVAKSLMTGKGEVIDHPMFAKALGAGCGWGPCSGRIAPAPMTFASSKTENGKIYFYSGEGKFTDDKIPQEFFGCAGVAQITALEHALLIIGRQGFRHHVSVTPGHYGQALDEALINYLEYEKTDL